MVMAAELVETSRLWARQNAAIDPEWAERLGGAPGQAQLLGAALVTKRESAMAHERVTLYGVPSSPTRLASGRCSRSWPASSSSGTRWSTASGGHGTASSRPTGGCSRRPRSSSTAHAAAASWSTSTPSSTSTTHGSLPRWSPVPTSTAGGSRSDASTRTCSTFDPEMLVHEGAEVRRGATSPTSGARGRSTLPLSYHFEPGNGGGRGHHRRPGRDAEHRRRRPVHLERARACARSWSPH